MFMEERQQEIAEAIARSGKIIIAEIVEKYHISDESARRDLRMLEQKGLCKRTHGGAIRLGQINMIPPRDRDYSAMPVFENYRRIARQAVKLVQENDVIYLTSGSFGFILLSLLPRGVHYTLVVNSVDLAKELREPWCFRARTVATTTTALGRRSAMRHLISRNFSAPRSAPNPASVTA